MFRGLCNILKRFVFRVKWYSIRILAFLEKTLTTLERVASYTSLLLIILLLTVTWIKLFISYWLDTTSQTISSPSQTCCLCGNSIWGLHYDKIGVSIATWCTSVCDIMTDTIIPIYASGKKIKMQTILLLLFWSVSPLNKHCIWFWLQMIIIKTPYKCHREYC